MGGFGSGKKHFARISHDLRGRTGARAHTPPERVKRAKRVLHKAIYDFNRWLELCRSATISTRKHSFLAEKARREYEIDALRIDVEMAINDMHEDRIKRASLPTTYRPRRKGVIEGLV